MKTPLFILILAITGVRAFAQIPVTDAASILQQELSTAETLAQWAQSIAQLKIQVSQSNQQIAIQTDLRSWAGNPSAVAVNINLSTLSAGNVTQVYGQNQTAIVNVPNSVASLNNTSSGTYRALQDTDLNGNSVQHDPLTYRKYSVLDAQQQNYEQVVSSTNARQQQLQQDLASTLVDLKNASTDAEVQKQSAKVPSANWTRSSWRRSSSRRGYRFSHSADGVKRRLQRPASSTSKTLLGYCTMSWIERSNSAQVS